MVDRACRFLFFVFCFLGSCQANAGVFQCVKPNGEIEFRDRPCASTKEEQSFLPHQYSRTDSVSEKTGLKQEKKLQQEIVALTKHESKQEKLQARARKKQEKALAMAERRRLRCERLAEKIARIELQLQQGKRIKTYKRLEAELAQAMLMQKRYCSKTS